MVKGTTSPKGLKSQALIRLGLLTGILLLMNVISSFWFTRIDLTGDKRFTLSPASRNLVANLKDVVFIRVYLEGEFSPGFDRLRTATRELLDELRQYSNGNLEYEFIDPSANPDEKERNRLFAQLYQKGIQPTTLEERTREGVNRTYVFPGAVVSYANTEMTVQLLQSQLGVPPQQMLNNSIQNLEYEFCNAITKATNPARPVIAFLEGHGELDTAETADFASTLKNSYSLKRVTINGQLDALKGYKAVVIAKPDSAFNEKDKFVIDQYVMNGGKAVFLIDQLDAVMDSLKSRGEMIALGRDLKLDDMLFRYGARVNYDLVQDMLSAMIPVVTGTVGNQPKQQLMPWYYFPVMTSRSTHPVVNNLNAVKGQFVSSVDAIQAPGIRSTVLLTTSGYSRIVPAPVRVSLGIMQFKPDPSMFPQRDVPVMLLVEGEFTSLYKNRLPPAISESVDIGFKASCNNGKVIVAGDGDLIRNDVVKGRPVPLGYDRYTNSTFGNKDLLLRAIDYLCDESGIMALRNKDFRLRLIDPAVLEADTRPLRMLNVCLPLAAVLITGVIRFYRRRRKYVH